METKPTVYAAIAAVIADLAKTGIAKDQVNQGQRFKFRGIDDVYNALAPLLAKHKLIVLPRVTSREATQRESKGGGVLFHTVLGVEYDFVSAEDGSKHTVAVVGEAMDSGDKSISKALSIAYKYAAFQAFCIPTEGDHDPDAQTHEVKRDEPRISKAQAQAFFDAAKAKGLPPEEIKALVKRVAGVESSAQIPAAIYDVLMREVAA